MADNERLTPAEEDIRNQALLQDLRYMHKNPDKAQSLERMRKRLLTTEYTSPLNSMQASRQFMHKTKQGRIQFMHNIQDPIAQKRVRYLNVLIAGVIAALLIGSLLFAVTHVNQGGTASPNNTHAPTSAPIVPPTPTALIAPPTPTAPIANPTPITPVAYPTPTSAPIAKPTPTVAPSH
ncbi:MAG: hypothetical protein H0V70_17795 [Ktedonobacteraceae bacterium]|nr:hypothetical protein [Ktedonobacteraceae bacterium]